VQPRPAGTYFQRDAKAFVEQDRKTGKRFVIEVPNTRDGQRVFRARPRDPSRRILSARLNCGHEYVYSRNREVPGGSKTTSFPCRSCGAVPRSAFERQRENGFLRFALRRAITTDFERMEALMEFVTCARELTTFPPSSIEAERLYERAARAAHEAGLDETPEDRRDAN
jgi:hypothetical protein